MAVYKSHGENRFAKIAGVDLTDKLCYAAALNAAGEVILADGTNRCVGAIFETAVQGRPATFATGELLNFVAGGAFDAGDTVTVDTDGRVIKSTDASGIGTAYKAVTAAGQVAEILFDATSA